MIVRIQIIILILSLLNISTIEARETDSRTVQLQNLLYIHNNILNENVQVNGKKLIDQTFHFIKDPKNKKVLQTKAGAALLRQQTMLANYLAVKSHLEKCIKNREAQKQLNARILDASLQSMKNNTIDLTPCLVSNKGITDFTTFNKQIMKVMKQSIAPEVKSTLSDTILTNSARALLNLKYKFDPWFSGNSIEIANIVKQFPARNRPALTSALNNYIQKIRVTEKKLSAQEMQLSLNRSIDNLKANNSTQQLLAEVQTPAGTLLLTPTLKDRKKHIEAKDLPKIIKEAEAQILEEKKDTLDESSTDGLVNINPFATGEMLLAHPEYAGVVCDAINNINSSDANKAKFNRYFRIGAAVLGGALILTGVGAVAGAYVMTGSLTAGLAAGTVAGSVLATSTTVGVVSGLGSALYEGTTAYQAHREMIQLENAFLTNNGDAKNLEDARRALEVYKENRTSALINLASAGINFVSFGKLFSLANLGAKGFTLTELKAANSILETMAKTKVALKIKAAMAATKEFSAAKVDLFLYRLAKSGESVRIKILELMKNGRFTSKELREMIEDALKAAKNCV